MNREGTTHPPQNQLTFRWLGVGGIQLRWREKVLLIDPFLTRPSIMEVLLKPLKPDVELLRNEIPCADAILITHAHYDHVMDTPEIIRYTGAKAYGSSNVVQILRAEGIPSQNLIAIYSGDELEIDPFKIKVIEGKHIPIPFFSPPPLTQAIVPPRRVWHYQMDACFSFFIENTSPSILVWHSIEARGGTPAEVLIVDSELSISTLEKLVDVVKPQCIIPVHWDDFFLPLNAPLKTFFRPPEKRYFRLGRLHLPSYVEQLQRLVPNGHVHLPKRLEEVDLRSIIDSL